jgi:transcriptional antiterminator RfaH
MMNDDLSWYCLRTKPKTERITSTILRAEAGLEVFCPFIRFERARRSGRLWVTEAMFPGYVFARFRFTTQYRQVQASRGVMKIVNFGGQPAVVSDQIVTDLRNSVKDEETVVIEPTVQIGEEVNVVEGPFRGIKAVVSRLMPGRERVALLLEVLGMEREVEVGLKAVLPDIPHPMAKTDKGG